MQIHQDARRSVLVDLLTVYGAGGKCIVFTSTKRDADEVSAAIASSMPTEVRLFWGSIDSAAVLMELGSPWNVVWTGLLSSCLNALELEFTGRTAAPWNSWQRCAAAS